MKRHFCINPMTILVSHQAVPHILRQNYAHDRGAMSCVHISTAAVV